jgi:hypothetical protein
MKMLNLQENKDGKMPEWLEKHPLVAAIKKENSDAIQSRRAAALAEIDRVQKEASPVIADLEKKVEKFASDFRKLDDQKAALVPKVNEIEKALRETKHDLERAVFRQEVILRETVDPEIVNAIDFFRDELRKDQWSERVHFTEMKGAKVGFDGSQPIYHNTNHPAILAAAGYLREAIQELEEMKMTAGIDTARIEELRRGIPSIDNFTQHETLMVPVEKDPFDIFKRPARPWA